jgi:hypothetical protein
MKVKAGQEIVLGLKQIHTDMRECKKVNLKHSQMIYTQGVIVPHESWTFGPNMQVVNMVQIRFLIYHWKGTKI